jgi:hypothetical protein
LKVVTDAATVPICENVVQLVPEHRSIRYCVIVPPVSVAAVHDRLICAGVVAAAVRLEGAVKVGAAVVADAVLE